MSRSRHISFSFSGLLAVSAAFATFIACAGGDVPVDDRTGSGGSQVGTAGGSGGSAGSNASGSGGMAGGSMAGAGMMGGSDTGGSGGTGGSGSSSGGCAEAPQILVSKCGTGSGCHGSGSPFSAFAVDAAALEGFVDKAPASGNAACGVLIDSVNAADSLIVKKVTGTQPSMCGGAMPFGTPGLPADEATCVETWIDSEFGG
jgi:hypothetical protein